MNKPIKTLTMVVSSFGRPELQELLRRERADEFPRVSLFETTLNSDMLDERMLKSTTAARHFIYRHLPKPIVKVLEAYRLRKKYDAIISWGERVAILLGLLFKITRTKKPNIALVYWISKPKQAPLIKLSHKSINRIITWSLSQHDYAISQLGLPPQKVVYIPYGVDQNFWRPFQTQTDIICSVGNEMRDYATLIEAMKGLKINCHIVAGEIRIIGKYSSDVKTIKDYGTLPTNVTSSKMNYVELRNLYARSKFVVLPLLPSETSSGLTVMLEAMSMEKAIICSKIKGHIDVIEDGKTGIFVPQGDPIALRKAIQYLLDNPDVAEAMGKEGRKYIELHHTIDQFVNKIKEIVEEEVGKKFEPQLQ